MRAAARALLAGALLLAGCVPSLHPLYTEKDLVFTPELLGTWSPKGGKESWAFSADEPRSYSLVYTDEKGRAGKFRVRLLRLEGKRFLDLYPEDPARQGNGYYALHLVKAHSFLYVESLEPRLRLAGMNPHWLERLLARNPGAIAHERRGEQIVLTAATPALQAFVLKHLATKEAFAKPVELERTPGGT